MASALRALPELLRRPRIARPRVVEFHLGATALAANLNLDVTHARDSSVSSRFVATRCPGGRHAEPPVDEVGFPTGCSEQYTRRSLEVASRMSIIVPGVVLAAGRSSRMGRPKALLPTGRSGETFVARIVRTLREGGVDDVLVVAADEADSIGRALVRGGPPPRVVVNETPELGQLSSLQVALRVIDRPGVGGLLVTLVDVPLISAETVRILLDAYRRTRAPIVRPVRRGRHGHPVIFDRVVFDELRRVRVGEGARVVVRAHRSESLEVAVEADGPFLDIDTPVDYERVFGRSLPDAATDTRPGD